MLGEKVVEGAVEDDGFREGGGDGFEVFGIHFSGRGFQVIAEELDFDDALEVGQAVNAEVIGELDFDGIVLELLVLEVFGLRLE
jgi:hypothetical protein